MRLRLLLTGCCLHAVTARRPPADAVAQKHINEGALNAYAIGEGFEGSASDWTEYVVWSVGVAALIFYLSGTVKINVYNIDEEPIKLLKSIDKKTFEAWRDICYLKMVQVYPKHYIKILNSYNWDKVTKSVDELYK